MLISLLVLLLLSNALTTGKDKSILFSRVVIIAFICTSFLAWNNLFIKPLEKGIGICGGLFNVTTFTQTINILILLLIAVILGFTTFYPRKIYNEQYIFAIHVAVISISFAFKANLNIIFTPLQNPIGFSLLFASFAGIMFIFRFFLYYNRLPSTKHTIFVFLITFTSLLSVLLVNYFHILSVVHPYILFIVEWTFSLLGLEICEISFNIIPRKLNFYSNSSSRSGYEADISQTPSSNSSVIEGKYKMGALVDGLSYDVVMSIKSSLYTITTRHLRQNISISVGDLIQQCPNPYAHQVIKKAYSLSNIEYDKGCVFAMKNIGREDVTSINFSPAANKLFELGRD